MTLAVRAVVCVLVLVGRAGAASPADPGDVTTAVTPAKRVVILTCDGMPKWLLDRWLAAGKLPHLAAMIRAGTSAEFTTSNFPNSTTPPGHAALYTGCYGHDNGIVGFRVPRLPIDQHDLTEYELGFDSRLLRAEPLWVTLARAGQPSLLMHTPHSWPLEPFGAWKRFGTDVSDRLGIFSGYSGTRMARDHVYRSAEALRKPGNWTNPPENIATARELEFTLAGSIRYRVLFYDDPADPVRGLDTAAVSADGDFATAIKFKPVAPGQGRAEDFVTVLLNRREAPFAGFGLRLFQLDPAGKSLLLYRTACYEPANNLPREARTELLAAAGPFIGNGASYAYGDGDFGPPIPAGGDGSAEAAYRETVDYMARHQTAAVVWALGRQATGLIVGYIPVPDEAGHLWAGYLDPDCDSYSAELAARLEPHWLGVAETADRFVGGVRAAAGPDTVVAVSSDHGMRGFAGVVRPNVILREAGLLAVNGARIDLAKTQVIYHPAGHGYVVVNTTDRKGGIVPPEKRGELVAAAKKALEAARDPQGRPLFGQVWDADPTGGILALGRPDTGDLFLVPRAGLKLEPFTDGPVLGPAKLTYTGHHDGPPTEEPLRTLMVFAGGPVAAGRTIGPVRHIDLAPTVLRLLGVAPGPKMVGQNVLP